MENPVKDVKYSALDNGGTIASNRLSYQQTWAILKIIELYKENNDFIIIFEGKSDIDIKINGLYDYYQVKTQKNGNISLVRLTKKQDNILDKLNKINKENLRSLNIVSNNFSIFSLNELSNKGKKLIQDNECFAENSIDFNHFYFIKSDLSIEGSLLFLKGVVHDFLANHCEIQKFNLYNFLYFLKKWV